MQILIDETGDKAISDAIISGLRAYNQSKIGPYQRIRFSLYIKDNDDKTDEIIGGLTGVIFGDICAVEIAWVHENFRLKGLGTALFSKLEKYARENKCKFLQLDTTDFQARPFYEKLGFTVIATLPKGFMGWSQYIMRKELS